MFFDTLVKNQLLAIAVITSFNFSKYFYVLTTSLQQTNCNLAKQPWLTLSNIFALRRGFMTLNALVKYQG